MNSIVVKTGIHFLPCGFIGVSPDGLVGDTKIIEVKCAYSLRNLTFEKSLESKNCILTQTNGELTLKPNHDYYHQIQGLLHCTGRTKCDLIYWTEKWQKVIKIQIDPKWAENIDVLTEFYVKYLLPYLFGITKLPLSTLNTNRN
jgi:hypothetical protein